MGAAAGATPRAAARTTTLAASRGCGGGESPGGGAAVGLARGWRQGCPCSMTPSSSRRRSSAGRTPSWLTSSATSSPCKVPGTASVCSGGVRRARARSSRLLHLAVLGDVAPGVEAVCERLVQRLLCAVGAADSRFASKYLVCLDRRSTGEVSIRPAMRCDGRDRVKV